MMKKIHYIYMVLVAVALASCNDWLDVQPHSQIEDSELFSSESGYKEALAGVYSSMVGTSTYAKEMTFGFIGVLGQEWDYYSSAQYDAVATYDYEAAYPTNYINAIWKNNYTGISNVNNLLAHIDGGASLFSEDNYEVIKGEALALRAMLHFDLLRCFGVSFAVNPDMPSIPYSTALDYHVFPQLTVAEAATQVLADLLQAEALLREADPIVTGRVITELDDNGYLINRRVHLNYYAVKALQARVYMWMERYDEALSAADEVIASNVFTWSTLENMERGYDRCLADEHIFALNNLTLKADIADNYFSEGSTSSFAVNRERLLTYYDNATQDYRYTFLFKAGTGTTFDNRYITKYDEPATSDSYYRNKMPLIRMPEVYLIKSEAEYRTSLTDEALSTLNELRTRRNLPALQELPSDYYAELINEYRREFLGEGQLFFLYKRLNHPVIAYSDIDPVATRSYTFPLPLSETQSAEREANR